MNHMPEARLTGLHSKHLWILISVIIISLGLHLWGIRRDLPFTPEADEPIFVTRSVYMAASGDLNPAWFGNPGSTVIYPLAALFHIWNAVSRGGMWLRPDPSLQVRFDVSPSEFYLLGRLLTSAFSVASVPLVYRIGQQLFGESVGLLGTWFWVLSPITVDHAQMVRTDSAGVFFGALSLWLCLRVYDHPTITNQGIAGLAIGLSIATRYFMIALIPVLLVIDGLLLWQQRILQPSKLKAVGLGIVAGLLAILAAFALSTPYFFLDFAAALQSLRIEARDAHLGADGLSPAGNLLWYLKEAIPLSLTWPEAVLATIGIVLGVWRRQLRLILSVGFILIFLIGISLSPLHWQRWLIQILPLLALFAASALITTIAYLSARLSLEPIIRRAFVALAILLVSVVPARELVSQGIYHVGPSPRILARQWVLQNLPPGSRIVEEAYTAPLKGAGFEVYEFRSLATSGYTLDKAFDYGIRYAIASSFIYGRYMAEPGRYKSQVAFYQKLFADGRLLQQFEPSTTYAGPTIRIYELRGQQ